MADILLDTKAIQILEQHVGKQFERYSYAPFLAPDAFEVAGLYIGGNAYKLTASLEVIRRFFENDDVAILKLEECAPSDIVSILDSGEMKETTVCETIVSVDIVNDCETVRHDGEERCLTSTKGLIFHFASGEELSFELGTWFSELISIKRGRSLIKDFSPIDDFLDEWEDSDGYTPACSREVISIK